LIAQKRNRKPATRTHKMAIAMGRFQSTLKQPEVARQYGEIPVKRVDVVVERD
jgi:hypothetical protein